MTVALGQTIVSLLGTGVYPSLICRAPAVSMLPVLVKDVLKGDVTDLSYLTSAFGIGAVIGALMVAVFKRSLRPWRAFAFLSVMAVAQIGLAFSLHLSVAVICTGLIGMMLIATMVSLGAAMQHAVPDQYRGRVMSFQSLAFRSGQPLGSLIAGAVALGLGIGWVFGIYGAALLVALAVIGVMIKRFAVVYRTADQNDATDAID